MKRPQAGKEVKEEAVVPTLTLTSTSTTLVSTLTPRRKERIKGMKQRDKVMLKGKKDFQVAGLHKLWYPGIRDRSTWGKFGAHGEHGDVFLFSNLGAL